MTTVKKFNTDARGFNVVNCMSGNIFWDEYSKLHKAADETDSKSYDVYLDDLPEPLRKLTNFNRVVDFSHGVVYNLQIHLVKLEQSI